MPDPTGSTPQMIRLYHWFSEHLGGEPGDVWVYEPGTARPSPDGFRPSLKHIMVWPADDEVDVTSFQTLGMSEQPIPGADYAAELHMGVRAFLPAPDRERVARFLANLTEYPFQHNRTFDWWHVVGNPGEVPLFPHCPHLLLHPRFTDEGFDTVEADGVVRIFYVVPVTPLERHLLVEHGREAFLDYVRGEAVDLLADREDPPGRLRPMPETP